jgi:hypothetical protein
MHAKFSPDDHWIAYESAESGRFEIYVVPFSKGPTTGLARRVSADEAYFARWRRDGREIFYYSYARRRLLATSISVRDGAVQIGMEHEVIDPGPVTIVGYDLSPDQRFLLKLRTQRAAAQPLIVVQNWASH